MAERHIKVIEYAEEEHLLVEALWDGKRVKLVGAPGIVQYLQTTPIVGKHQQRLLPMQDGQAYMDALLVHFSGSRVRAMEVPAE